MLRLVQFFAVLVLATSSPPIHHEFSAKTASKVRATDGRLAGEVLPTAYKLQFTLADDFFNTTSFSGTATITLEIGNITNAESSFQLHAKDLDITSMNLTVGSSPVEVTFSESDPATDLITIVPAAPLVPGVAKLEMVYTGLLSPTSMVGMYLSSYVDEFKQTRYAVATQFEDIHARKAFPCFDEPEMKATFTVSITYPHGYHAVGNTGHGNPVVDSAFTVETTTFDKSPIMSTYLVAVVVSRWNCKNGDVFNNKTIVELCSEISAFDGSAKLALDAAPLILERMSTFTNYNYSDVKKLSLAAIPDFAPGAMENWGLVTFREVDLLWTEGESSSYYKQLVYTVLTHELSHQWFGDLLTVDWWSSMFLNEGFATYCEYHIADMEQPDWHLTQQFVIEQLQSALDTDSYNTTLPLSYDVADPDYSSRSNDLSYNKGGSILRMVHHFLTFDNYQLGIVDYISNNLLGSVNPDILWASFDPHVANLPAAQKPPADMLTVMENWTTKPGYPLLTVTSNGNGVIITQEQFLISGDNETTQWYVPITYTTSKNVANFEKTSTQAWLKPGASLNLTGVLDGADWIILNNQQVGYYRVSYDQALLDKISSALESDVTTINEMSRAQLVDDQFNFAKAGRIDYNALFDFLTFLNKDSSYYSWSSAFNGYDYLLKKTASDDVRDALKEHIREQMQTLLGSVPDVQADSDSRIPMSHMANLTQILANTWACKVDNETCSQYAREQFVNYTNYPSTKPEPNMRSLIYCNGLKHSTSITIDFRFLFDQYTISKIPSEKVTILQALGCANDATVRGMYLSMVLSEPSIRLQDARYVFSSVYSNNPEGVTEVLNFVMDNYEELTTHFGSTSTVTSVLSTLGDLITAQSQIDKMLSFSETAGLDADIKNAAVTAAATATKNLEIISALEKAFTTYFDISSGSISIGSNYVINLVCVLIGYTIFNFY